MSDSEDSIITYTAVSNSYGGLSDFRSSGVDGPPVMPEDPYAYVADILLAEEQPLSAAASRTTESPGYIDESDPVEDPEDDLEEDPADYPADEGDEGDDKDEPYTSISLPSDTEISRLIAIPTPPPSLLSLLSSPLPHIPSPPLPLLSLPPTDPTYEEATLGTYELRECSAVATARHRKQVRDDLYRFVDTIERGEGSTPAARERERLGLLIQLGHSRSMPAMLLVGVIALRTQVAAQRTEITDLRAADRIFQTTVGSQHEEIRELRAAHRKLHAQFIRALIALKSCQTQLTVALRRIQILETARVPAQPEKMAPKRTTKTNPATTTTTTTTFVTDAQLEELIEQGIARALAARDADRNTVMIAIIREQEAL
uniref:Reverse transcriptase domain-containing protein n=1 Tax=Tanacetum cinerariifolium TaxID=118510 RepID=A0A6L2NJN8_TANCI|nr:hypothetical protein [Tanacetum cinerariifolium]